MRDVLGESKVGSRGLARMALGVAVLAIAAAWGWAADATELCREADKLVRESQRRMYSSKYDEAAEALAKAATLIQQVKAADPENRRLRSVEQRYERQKTQLEKRMNRGAAKPSEKPSVAKEPEAGGKLPGGVTHRLRRVGRELDRAERALKDDSTPAKRRSDWVRRHLASADDTMAEIQKRYGDQIPAGHPDVKAVEERVAQVKAAFEALSKTVAGAQAEAKAAEAKTQALAEEWLAKLRPYVASRGQEGHDPEKYFIAGGTVQVEELLKRLAVYNEASAVFAEYQKVEFPTAKPDSLAAVERDLGYRLKSFPEQLQGSMKSLADAAARQIESAAAFLARKQEWRTDPKAKPYVLSESRLASLRMPLEVYKKAAGADDAKAAALEAKLAAIVKENEQRRKVAVERTFMIPDRFTGAELAALKAKAKELVSAKVEGVTVLRTTIISSEWKEERKTEWTDTTKTAVRHRITRSVTAQAAGKAGGETRLYTVYLAQDRKSDGSWGPLYGNLHQSADRMLEANVSKAGP
jgi:hypothetical protein